MNGTAFIKSMSGVAGLVLASLFPTETLITLLYCGFLLGIVDTYTGMNAALEKGENITVHSFISKIGRKLIRSTAYLAMAWVVAQIVSQTLKTQAPLSEPVAFVMSALLATETLSILKNLSAAHNNIPIIDKYFKKWVQNFKDSVFAEQEEAAHPAKENN